MVGHAEEVGEGAVAHAGPSGGGGGGGDGSKRRRGGEHGLGRGAFLELRPEPRERLRQLAGDTGDLALEPFDGLAGVVRRVGADLARVVLGIAPESTAGPTRLDDDLLRVDLGVV